jgi:hypothetical protein
MKYSKITGCFYPEEIKYPSLPSDVVDVPQADFNAAMARNVGDTLALINNRIVIVPAPAPTRSEQIAKVWGLIKAERDRRKYGGVQVGAKWFHSDDASRILQMGLVMMGNAMPNNVQWKTLDNSFIPMTPALAQQIFNTIAASDQFIFGTAEAHGAALEISSDPASYDYSTGWPKIYGE